ncbi:MAG: TIGR00730 family Rossman fold protein [bacterium]|nr:TIGR00730 family Rossman fold protein [bacterium]
MKGYIAVFCGSRSGNNPVFVDTAKEVAQHLVDHDFGLVYGGGKVGLMGVIADEMLALGGEVIGVIPEKLFTKEVAHAGITELITVQTMHERKAIMADKSKAFIALPGGIGTLEELFEVFTWAQIGYHKKPCALLNVDGFYDPLNEMLDHTVASDFLAQDYRESLISKNTVGELLKEVISKIDL